MRLASANDVRGRFCQKVIIRLTSVNGINGRMVGNEL